MSLGSIVKRVRIIEAHCMLALINLSRSNSTLLSPTDQSKPGYKKVISFAKT